ncbi:MAG: 16S rRNA (cytosine(1402)-N(4))-methyltransferase RsmH [Bradyrhizobium sp.]|nr:MAG: 16S rRNA (cytosine(1402)-N(4))-methyltransferase RsmH [Bradyrhizobium sp.]
MLAQDIPPNDRRRQSNARRASALAVIIRGPAGAGAHGSFPLPFRQSLRRQGADFRAGGVSRRAGEGRFRRHARPSGARCAGARLRRVGATQGDQRAARIAAALFVRARGSCGRLARLERDPAPRFRRPHPVERAHARLARPHHRGGLCRARPQVSDLGAQAVRGAFRGGQGSSAAIADGDRRRRDAGGAGVSAGRGEGSIAAGGLARHAPVLLAEALQALSVREGGVYVDGTFGAGGYTRALLQRGARVVAIDRDPYALADGQALAAAFAGRLNLIEGRFADLDAIARRTGFDHVDGVALDVGVSSMQLDEAARGFSLRRDAPLDMRMEAKGPNAADILRDADEATIADILFYFGEERAARRIARAIIVDRVTAPYVSTRQLAEMIARVAPARPGEATHPATRTFQALRIAVNDELGQLLGGLMAAERALKPGGRLAVVSFHSLEDRIVKLFLARRSGRGRAPSRLLPGEPAPLAPSFGVAAGQPILPGPAEVAANPRARSAKLRFAERLDAPAQGRDEDLEALTRPPAARSGRG